MKLARVTTFIITAAIWFPAATAQSVRRQPGPKRELVNYRLSNPDASWVAKTMKRLTLREKVGQLIQVRVAGRFINRESEQFRELADAVRRNRIGGVTLFAGDVFESALLLNELQEMSDLPLFVAADFERGASFRITDTTSFPWTMAVGAAGSEDLAYQEGVVTAREARALGVNWIYAPVVDVNNNPDNPVINIRSYGEDPQLVARLGSAFIRGARDNGVLTTAKHFPGHGDTATDSHIGLPVISSDLARLDSVEMVPFRSAVSAGVDAVMTAHIAVPKVTGEPDVPATLSPRILTDLLRGTVHFHGLVVTDALEMGGVTSHYWTGLACIRALQAGADMLLLPQDTDVAINEVVRAVRRGDISVSRIDESVSRILSFKTRLGLQRERTAPIDRIWDVVAAPASQKLAQEIADRSITLLRDERHVLPISPLNPPKIFSLALSADPDANPGSTFQSQMRRLFPGVRTEAADSRIPDELATRILRNATAADVIVCATLVRVISGSGSVALPASARELLDKIMALNKPLVWVALGNPYLLRLYPEVSTYVCSFSYADVSQIAAAKAVAGEITISGRSPVSIPGCTKLGEGLQLPRLDLTLKPLSEGSGLAPGAFDETRKLLSSYINERTFPGGVLFVGYRSELVLEAVAGKLDYSPSAAPVNSDTIYDLASLSKVIATTSAAMMLVDAGRLLLDARVQDYLPEFQGPDKEKVRVADLLQHSSGLPAWLPIYKDTQGYDEFMKRVYATPLEYIPGTRTLYSDLGMILLGEIVSRAWGHPFEQLLSERLFGPLGMRSTYYKPAKSLLTRIAPTEYDAWRQRVVHGEVHDENAYAMGGVAGHAGLFSTAHDLAVFAQMMLNRGMYDFHRYFRPETVDLFTEGNPKSGREALGWQKLSPTGWTGKVFSASAYGHTGFTGTSIWIDPERQLFIILLTNSVHPTRKSSRIGEARQVLTESVLRALGIFQ